MRNVYGTLFIISGFDFSVAFYRVSGAATREFFSDLMIYLFFRIDLLVMVKNIRIYISLIIFYATRMRFSSATFIMSSAGSCNCGPVSNCPQVAPCAAAAVVAKGEKTYTPNPTPKIMDELELRAIALGGLDLNRQNDILPKELDLLERLGEDHKSNTNEETRTNPPSDHDLVRSSYLNSESSDIRKSPQKKTRKSTDKFKKSKQIVAIFESTITPLFKVDHSTTTIAPVMRKLLFERMSIDKMNGKYEVIKCNSEVMRQIIIDNISENSSASKRAVNQAAEETFGGNIDVVCSRGHFSYVYSSNLFCEASKGDVTCIAYRQS